MSVINHGDLYVLEVSASVAAVMNCLGHMNPYHLIWQSQVGPSTWIRPQARDALEGLTCLSKKRVMLVPIAFTSNHIETLYELDLEYGKEACEDWWGAIHLTSFSFCQRGYWWEVMRGQLGMKVHCAESLNGSPVFIRMLVDIVAQHLKGIGNGVLPTSVQMGLWCHGVVTIAWQYSIVAVSAGRGRITPPALLMGPTVPNFLQLINLLDGSVRNWSSAHMECELDSSDCIYSIFSLWFLIRILAYWSRSISNTMSCTSNT